MIFEQVQPFLAALGVPEPVQNGRWVMAQCPLAPFTHQKGTDHKPSFGINLETGNFNCFSCESGSLGKLLQILDMYVQKNPHLAHKYRTGLARQILDDLESITTPLPEFEEFSPHKHEFVEWPQYFLDSFLPWRQSERARWYLREGRVEIAKGKGGQAQPVSDEVADILDLRYDTKYDRLVSPYRTVFGKLAGARGRTIGPHGNPHHDYTWNKVNNSELVWYNEGALAAACDARLPVVIVEGQFDVANLLPNYTHVLGGLTAKGSLARMGKLLNTPGVLLMLDNDSTGEKATARYIKHLGDKVPVGIIGYPKEFKDPGALPEQVKADIFGPILEGFDK